MSTPDPAPPAAEPAGPAHPVPSAPPGYGPYLPYQPPPPPAPPNPRTRKALIAVTVAWGLLLAGTGIWYSFHGRPTAREQTTIAAAEPVVAQAMADLVRAAGPAVIPAVSGFEKAEDCAVTPARGGAEYRRLLWLYTPAGPEPALLDRIAGGLPGRYHAVTRHSAGGAVHTLSADAGYYVAVTGSVVVPGLVQVRADTGCRTLGRQPAADPAASPGENPLGINGSWHLHTLACGLRTLAVTGPASRPWSTLPGNGTVVSTPEVYATRDGHAARSDGGTVTWTVTSGTCR